ncbi:MAG: peptidylprolyl isomerase [Alphaproteobacteria bacterium]|nr:peptidylprolyl isomerase [Alphaproteobacteria bacterium]
MPASRIESEVEILPESVAALLRAMAALLALAFLGLQPTGSARAQDIQRIAAIINDEVISAQDLEQRIDVAVILSGLENTAETRRRIRDQVLRAIITERLQMQEAARLKIPVTQDEMNRAIAVVERQNRIPPGAFEESLRAQGIPVQSVVAQIRAEVAWSKVVRRRVLPTINISDEEIDAALLRHRQTQNQPEYLVSEIFLAVDSVQQEEEIRRTAIRLAELVRAEQNFSAIARQFSQGATASQGGDIGWVQPGVLAEEVDAVLPRLAPGQVSDPIRTTGGYYIIALRNRRSQGEAAADPTVTLRQIALPLPAQATQQDLQALWNLAAEIAGATRGCGEFERVAREVRSAGQFDLGRVPLSALSPQARQLIEPLPVGQASQPVRAENAVLVYMVCDRTEGGIGREEIREQLLQRRVELQARRILRDLRRDAVVEFR